jgi:hypothetical protein
LEVGSDGYLYVVSLGQGKIFRIVPGDGDASTLSSLPTEETISTGENEQGGQDPIIEGQEEGQQQEDVDEEEDEEEDE